MINKIKDFRSTLKNLSDLQQQLGSANLDGLTESDTKNILDNLGVNVEDLEKNFQKSFIKRLEVNYVLKSDNKELEYAYETDSGFDLRSNESFILKPLERKLVSTGV